MPELDDSRFAAVTRLHGSEGFAKLQQAHVCVIGIGGVGSWVCESLARCGIGEITLIDADDVCVTNINRQIHALSQTIGQAKVTAMAQRITDINPVCKVNARATFFLASTAQELLNTPYDFVVDAIDSISHKTLLIALCKHKNINIVTVGGAGGKTEIAGIQVLDLGLTHGDKLLSKTRSILRKQYGFPKFADKKFNIPAVFSAEPVKLPWCDLSEPEEKTSLRLDCNNGFGTDMTVISSFGVTAAHYVIQSLIGSKPNSHLWNHKVQ
ncbi:MAG: tRNA threonylcarbamoyladenosine dehydratase [Proteobacteria bacterium]|nr:tRNA threonylcarbamoyladenosine dehydratase [Pseudomonadota bacterium]